MRAMKGKADPEKVNCLVKEGLQGALGIPELNRLFGDGLIK